MHCGCSYRSVRNLVIDVRRYCPFLFWLMVPNLKLSFYRVAPDNSQGTGLHWQVSQATSLMNIVVYMSTASNTTHQGCSFSSCRTIYPRRYLDGKRKVISASRKPIYLQLTRFIYSGGFMGDLVFNGGMIVEIYGGIHLTPRHKFQANSVFGVETSSEYDS